MPETAVTAFANANIEKRRKSMNGKRVRMAVMSAVLLSALAVSGCSSEGSISYNGSGEKADDVSASLSAPATSDTTSSSESKETQEQTSSESKPAVTSTNKAETTAVTTKKDNAVKRNKGRWHKVCYCGLLQQGKSRSRSKNGKAV